MTSAPMTATKNMIVLSDPIRPNEPSHCRAVMTAPAAARIPSAAMRLPLDPGSVVPVVNCGRNTTTSMPNAARMERNSSPPQLLISPARMTAAEPKTASFSFWPSFEMSMCARTLRVNDGPRSSSDRSARASDIRRGGAERRTPAHRR